VTPRSSEIGSYKELYTPLTSAHCACSFVHTTEIFLLTYLHTWSQGEILNYYYRYLLTGQFFWRYSLLYLSLQKWTSGVN